MIINEILLSHYAIIWNKVRYALNASGVLEDLQVLSYAIGYYNRSLPFDQEYEDGVGAFFQSKHGVIPANEQLRPNTSNSSLFESFEASSAALQFRSVIAALNGTLPNATALQRSS